MKITEEFDEKKSSANTKVYLSVGVDFERSQVLLVNVNENGRSSVIGVSVEQARCLSRLLESCAGQLESQIQRNNEQTEENRFWTKQRADFVAVNKMHDVVIVEMKSCWADFATDRKWRGYLPHCNKFYFGADTETAKRIAEDLNSDMEEKRVGVIAFEPRGESFRMKFLRPACNYAREVPVFYMLWQMAARAFDFPWDSPRKIISEKPDEQEK